jgi:hypothetical protein
LGSAAILFCAFSAAAEVSIIAFRSRIHDPASDAPASDHNGVAAAQNAPTNNPKMPHCFMTNLLWFLPKPIAKAFRLFQLNDIPLPVEVNMEKERKIWQ